MLRRIVVFGFFACAPFASVLAAPIDDLCRAAEDGNEAGARAAIANGADVNAKACAGIGATPLHRAAWATWRAGEGIVTLLIANGADPDARQRDGSRPLHLAVVNTEQRARGRHDYSVIRALLDAGADVDAPDNNGVTPLIVALQDNGYFVAEKIADLLFARGPNVNAATGRGLTALHVAAHQVFSGVVGKLLERGANVHAELTSGQTALDLAAPGSRIANLLIARGACKPRTKWNGTACECAANHNDPNPDDDALECLPVITCGENQESVNNGTACECAANHDDPNPDDGILTCARRGCDDKTEIDNADGECETVFDESDCEDARWEVSTIVDGESRTAKACGIPLVDRTIAQVASGTRARVSATGRADGCILTREAGFDLATVAGDKIYAYCAAPDVFGGTMGTARRALPTRPEGFDFSTDEIVTACVEGMQVSASGLTCESVDPVSPDPVASPSSSGGGGNKAGVIAAGGVVVVGGGLVFGGGRGVIFIFAACVL